jgi:organic hydroperoxide reductase OsmC/OhrA
MTKQHLYKSLLHWTGNNGQGTLDYKAFERSYTIAVDNKPDILGSSDPSFRGDATRYNPEELLVASLSSCHMLWYLHLCAISGVIVVSYSDAAVGTMIENPQDGGRFTQVVLSPKVTVKESAMIEKALALHKQANRHCFIANSVSFEVSHIPVIGIP